MRHHPEHVAALIDDAGDAVHCAVVVPIRIDHAVRRRVAEQHPALALEPRNGRAVGDVIAFAMGDRDTDHLPGIVAAREWRIGTLDTQINVAADKTKLRIAHQYAGQQTRFAGDLKTVAYRQHEPAFGGEAAHRVHDRSARGNGAAAEIIAIGEAARKYD